MFLCASCCSPCGVGGLTCRSPCLLLDVWSVWQTACTCPVADTSQAAGVSPARAPRSRATGGPRRRAAQ